MKVVAAVAYSHASLGVGGKRRARNVREKLGVKEPTNERRISSLRPVIGELLKAEGGAYRSEEEEDEYKQAEQGKDVCRFG